jgi:pilus assembly protein CpaC
VTVEADVSLLKEKLAQVLPKEKIGVEAAGDSVVLSGEVTGPVAQQTAMDLALPYVGGKKDKVLNLMHIGGVQQVMVEVRLAEISREVGERLGINFSGISKSGNFGVNQLNQLAPITDLTRGFDATTFSQTISSAITAIGGWKAGGILWTAFLDALKRQNLGRVLAEPNLVTTSGQEASFLAGGEFPIPVPQSGVGGGSTITVEYKTFGVGLKFTPTVLDADKIALRVSPEVSELDQTISFVSIAGYVVPGLRTRRLTTHLEVNDGQTFAVAGLLSDYNRNIIHKFPVLGDLPILGTLFRSVNYQRYETELVALVTPHKVKPLPPGGARLPTDKWVEPKEWEKYLLGEPQGRQAVTPTPPATPSALPPGFGRQTVD